ncbi:MAG: YqaE/Pmp3 family membrane protein [bacterium]
MPDKMNVVIMAVFFPPLAVLMTKGFGREFWLNLALTVLGFYLGLIHAAALIERGNPA